jgi:lipopolysaccharide transport system ATP-binding protein
MSNKTLVVENLSKAYQIGQFSTGTISRDLERWWALIRKKEDPFLKIGEPNFRTKQGESNIVWSLKDLNFDILQGDAVGIIGKNGAGKSTLLKILSQVTTPTLGKVKIKGRVASLLEVGTGFHPELTGRENVYLNGAILGMRKQEIAKKFDEIVEFSGVERYIDTPVKRYSSGMYVRLAFAVAAHLESEILIVDEVLAVGDAEFQKKCLGKMDSMSKGQGRTILFVSHNMGSISHLCNNAIILDSGKIDYIGNANEAIEEYSKKFGGDLTSIPKHIDYNKKIDILNTFLFVTDNIISSGSTIPMGEKIKIGLKIKAIENIIDLSVAIEIKNVYGELISHIINEDDDFYIERFNKNEELTLNVLLDELFLTPGIYTIDIWLGTSHRDSHYLVENAFTFILEQSRMVSRKRELPKRMKLFIKSKWEKF